MPKEFIKGMDLCEKFYLDIVQKIINSEFPNLKYSAGLMDRGSEVLGFDTILSTDHDWGPRLTIFLDKKDFSEIKPKLSHLLDLKLPNSFMDYPLLIGKNGGSILKHRVEILTPFQFFKDHFGVDLEKNIEWNQWLLIPEQKLKTIRNGKLFIDELNINTIRKKLFFYPDDVWFYLMACDWKKIAQEEPFVGRAGDVSDELGSAIIATRLVHVMMHLCFLMEKEYPPYSKWFGTAFSYLKCAPTLTPIFQDIISSTNWKSRELNLIKAYEKIASMHNALNITEPLPAKVTDFHSRKYKVINGENFAIALKKQIKNSELKELQFIGSINQLTDTCDILEYNSLIKKFEKVFD